MLFKSYSRYIKDHTQDTFEEKTYYSYLNEATVFLKHAIGTEVDEIKSKKKMKELLLLNQDLIVRYLNITAYRKSSSAWRKLRRSLEVAFKSSRLSEEAKTIKSLNNQAPLNKRTKNKNRKRRMPKVDDNTYYTILKDRINSKDIDASSLIIICKSLGIRPAEAKNIKIIKINKNGIIVFINGAKKTLAGKRNERYKRGIDRILKVKYKKSLEYALLAIEGIDDKKIKSAQMRISRASRKLFPNNRAHFCLYSLRYQYGSDLKKALSTRTPESRKKIAAIMGHKNTSSITSYGHTVSGNTSFVPPTVHSSCLAEVNDNYEKAKKNIEGISLNLEIHNKNTNESSMNGPSLG